MPINQREILNVLRQLSEKRELKATVTQSFRGACTVGLFALGGGLIGGPVGLGIAGAIGSVCAAVQGKGKYKSVASVIMEDMTAEQRAGLARSVQNILTNIDAQDIAIVASTLLSSTSLQALVIREMGNYLKSEMGLSIL